MMNKKLFVVISTLIISLVYICSATAGVSKDRMKNIATKQNTKSANNLKSDTISSEVGLKIPEYGIAIDAVFNPELTDIIPGYHILNVVLSNHRADTISLNRKTDRWVVIDRNDKKHTAVNHVTDFNDKMWNELPEELQQLIDYPTMISPGKSVTIDVFVPNHVELANFKEVRWRSQHFAKEFNLFTNYEQKISLGSEKTKEFTIPKTSVDIENLPMQDRTTEKQQQFINSKYSNHPDIGDVLEGSTNTQQPFDPSLDDTIVMD